MSNIEEPQQVFDPVQNLKNYINQLEQAIIYKEQAIDIQRMKYFEIIKKFSSDIDQKQINSETVEQYLDSLNVLKEDFDEQLTRKKNSNIIRISKQNIIVAKAQESQQMTDSQDANISQEKAKRKYTKRKQQAEGSQQEPVKRKRRTKKEMEEARMQIMLQQNNSNNNPA